MVRTSRYIFFLLLLFLIACVKNEFTLDFNLKADVTDNYNVTYYATDTEGGLTIQAVASVREGKCILTGVTKKPTLLYITTRKSVYPLVVYAEKGNKIEITGEGKETLEWEVNGNEINEGLSQWRIENFSVLNIHDSDSVNTAVRDYVEKNNGNPVSTLLMLCYYDRDANEKEYTRLMASLKGEAKDNKWLSIAGRSDQLYQYYSYPAKLTSLLMHSDKNGSDTLYINHRDPLMLFFWQNNMSERKEIIDSIKKLEKEYPDSVIRIADISLDIDSIMWKTALRRDSLKNTKRFWAPMGMNDPALMKLKVNSLPYYIVFDKEGEQIYRGNHLGKAMKEYRQLHNTDSKK